MTRHNGQFRLPRHVAREEVNIRLEYDPCIPGLLAHPAPRRAPYRRALPFISVRDYLRAYIRFSLDVFKQQQGIDKYKARFPQRVTEFVERGMHNILAIVEWPSQCSCR
jgi:hypothetical protein